MIQDIADFRALDPFFRIIEDGLRGLVDGDHFFDLLADDVVFDFVITVPDYPRHVVGRDNLIELYRGYGSTFFLDCCYDLRRPVRHYRVCGTRIRLRGQGRPNRPSIKQPIRLRYRAGGSQRGVLARLPRPAPRARRIRRYARRMMGNLDRTEKTGVTVTNLNCGGQAAILTGAGRGLARGACSWQMVERPSRSQLC